MEQEEMIVKLAKDLADHIAGERGELEHISAQLAEIKAMQCSFFIPPKEHYDDHVKMKDVAKTYDKIAARIGSVVISLIIGGMAAWAALGAFFTQKP